MNCVKCDTLLGSSLVQNGMEVWHCRACDLTIKISMGAADTLPVHTPHTEEQPTEVSLTFTRKQAELFLRDGAYLARKLRTEAHEGLIRETISITYYEYSMRMSDLLDEMLDKIKK